jgi:hypothetical protein
VKVSLNKEAFATYPNPVVGNTFKLKVPDAQQNEIALSVSNLAGQTVFAGTAKKGLDGLFKVELSFKPSAGIYVVTAGQYSTKLIVE